MELTLTVTFKDGTTQYPKNIGDEQYLTDVVRKV